MHYSGSSNLANEEPSWSTLSSSSRTDPDDDVVDVTSFSSALDVVEIKDFVVVVVVVDVVA